MQSFIFKMPDLGEGIVEVEMLKWHVDTGQWVDKDAPIADVMTDKANVELTAPVSGRVEKLGCAVDEMIAVGADLIVFALAENSAEPDQQTSEAVTPKAENTVTVTDQPIPKPAALRTSARIEPKAPDSKSVANNETPAPISSRHDKGRALASPAVRRRAREMGVDLSLIAGSGAGGQVTRDDLLRFQQGALNAIRQPRSAVQQRKVSGLRRVIAQKLARSKRTIPHFSYIEEIELNELQALRHHLNEQRQKQQPRLTLLPFLMQAMVLAIDQFPDVNATFDDEAGVVTQYAGVHIGVATQTDQGLKVPVIRHAEAMDVWEKAAAIQRLSELARNHRIAAQDLSGSTITLSSLGKLGGLAATPIINKPEVAIIGVNRAEDRVVVRDGKKKIRHMMNLSSSFDHRIIDGYRAAEFIQAIKSGLENPVTLFMDTSI